MKLGQIKYEFNTNIALEAFVELSKMQKVRASNEFYHHNHDMFITSFCFGRQAGQTKSIIEYAIKHGNCIIMFHHQAMLKEFQRYFENLSSSKKIILMSASARQEKIIEAIKISGIRNPTILMDCYSHYTPRQLDQLHEIINIVDPEAVVGVG